MMASVFVMNNLVGAHAAILQLYPKWFWSCSKETKALEFGSLLLTDQLIPIKKLPGDCG
jgi:hypothetical protein